MPQYLLLAVGILSFFKDSLAKSLKDKNTKNIVVAVALLLLYRYLKGLENAKKWQNSPEGELVAKLQAAFHPIVDLSFDLPIFGNFNIPDGTNEEAVIQVAKEVAAITTLDQFTEVYQTLVKRNLNDDLTSEGVLVDFQEAYRIAKASGYTGSGGSTGSTGTSTGITTLSSFNGIKAGDTIRLTTKSNLRDIAKPHGVLTTAEADSPFTVDSVARRTVNGAQGVWFKVKRVDFFNWNNGWYQWYIVHNSLVKKA